MTHRLTCSAGSELVEPFRADLFCRHSLDRIVLKQEGKFFQQLSWRRAQQRSVTRCERCPHRAHAPDDQPQRVDVTFVRGPAKTQRIRWCSACLTSHSRLASVTWFSATEGLKPLPWIVITAPPHQPLCTWLKAYRLGRTATLTYVEYAACNGDGVSIASP